MLYIDCRVSAQQRRHYTSNLHATLSQCILLHLWQVHIVAWCVSGRNPSCAIWHTVMGNAAICLQDKVQAILDKAMFQPSPFSTASLQVCCLLLMLVCSHALLHYLTIEYHPCTIYRQVPSCKWPDVPSCFCRYATSWKSQSGNLHMGWSFQS